MSDQTDETGTQEQDAQAEMFPMGALGGEGPTAQSIIRRGEPVELTVSLSRAEVPNPSGGLFDPNKYGRALVTFIPSTHHPLPLREDDAAPQKVTGWKIRQDLRVTHVKPATDRVALIREEFQLLLDRDARAAGALLEELAAIASEVLAAA